MIAPVATSRARAFTLVEVMLAVVILGLGLLGLSALFAGAAATQQRAAEINLSVGVTRNAEAVLSRNFGGLAGPDLGAIADQEGEWFKSLSGGERAGWALTTSLTPIRGVSRATEDYGVYFRKRSNGGVLYQGPANYNAALAAGAVMSTPRYLNIETMTDIPNRMLLLPDARIDIVPGLIVRMTISSDDGAGGVLPAREVDFSMMDGDAILAESDPQASMAPAVTNIVLRPIGTSALSLTPPYMGSDTVIGPGYNVSFSTLVTHVGQPNRHPADFEEFVHIDLQATPNRPSDRASVRFVVKLEADQWLSNVEILPYTWRDDRLISLNDRLVYTPDPLVPGGRRPILGYTALLRTLASGGSQMVIFTYSIQPLGPVRSNSENIAFIPPETNRVNESNPDNDTGLMRLVKLKLNFDAVSQQFYVEADANSAAEKAAVEPGQILLMKESQDLDPDLTSEGSASTAGSDVPVRVVLQETRPDGTIRAYLDGSPRVKGRSPVRDLSGSSPPTQVTFWCFNPVVESLTSDRSPWRVRPVEARVFQTGVNY